MNDKELLELNALGLIPGPLETEENFFLRVDYCLKLKNHWNEFIPHHFKFAKTAELFEVPLKKIKTLFDVSPSWVPVIFNNYQLMPWHGGSAWIFQEKEELPTSAFLQLRQVFEKQPTYLKMYHLDELMAHEMAHVGRMMFQEPKFEELIAYQTSKSSFRRFFGAIVQSSTESFLFMLSIMLVLFFDVFFLMFDYSQAFYFSLVLKLVPVALIIYGIARVWQRHQQFKKATKHLMTLTRNKEMASAVIYRLQDSEIELFSRASQEEILSYIENQTSLRWQVIKLAYL